MDRPQSAGSLGIGFNGGELLLFEIGGCYCNNLFREAQKTDIAINSVHIDVESDWGGEPARALNVCFLVRVESPAPRDMIEQLIRHTDQTAEIPNSLRYGAEVRLRSFEAISTSSAATSTPTR